MPGSDVRASAVVPVVAERPHEAERGVGRPGAGPLLSVGPVGERVGLRLTRVEQGGGRTERVGQVVPLHPAPCFP